MVKPIGMSAAYICDSEILFPIAVLYNLHREIIVISQKHQWEDIIATT